MTARIARSSLAGSLILSYFKIIVSAGPRTSCIAAMAAGRLGERPPSPGHDIPGHTSPVSRRRIPSGTKLFVLRQVIGNREPRCFRADKDMHGRANGRRIDQCPHRHMHEGTVANHGIKQRPTRLAVRVVGILFAEYQQARLAFGHGQLVAFNPSKWLERRARRTPAVRTVAVARIEKLIGDGVANRTAITAAFEPAYLRMFAVRHECTRHESVLHFTPCQELTNRHQNATHLPRTGAMPNGTRNHLLRLDMFNVRAGPCNGARASRISPPHSGAQGHAS